MTEALCRCGFPRETHETQPGQVIYVRGLGCYHFVPADLDPIRSALPPRVQERPTPGLRQT